MINLLPPATCLRPLCAATVALSPAIAHAHPDPDAFAEAAFTQEPALVDCTLENGAAAQCYEFTAGYRPEGQEIGPFCPASVDDKGGLWDWDGEKAGLYRIDRDFLLMLEDLGYRFFDEDGVVNVVDVRLDRPGSGNACLSASFDESVSITMLLPVAPEMADGVTDLGTVGKVGVALDGVPIFADAPSVLDTGHMPALDVCGGHVDPGGWYHWHATATDIATALDAEGVSADCSLEQVASEHFGYAFDGFPMFGSREADGSVPAGLDACNGHVGETVAGATYHYHASESFPNLPPCLVGVVARDNFRTTAAQGIGATAGPGGGGPDGDGPNAAGGTPPDIDAAAAALGVEVDALIEALGPQDQRPDFAAVAKTLGVSEDALREALAPAR